MLVSEGPSQRCTPRRGFVCMALVLAFVLLVLGIQFSPYAVLPAHKNGTLAGIAFGIATGLVFFAVIRPRFFDRR